MNKRLAISLCGLLSVSTLGSDVQAKEPSSGRTAYSTGYYLQLPEGGKQVYAPGIENRVNPAETSVAGISDLSNQQGRYDRAIEKALLDLRSQKRINRVYGFVRAKEVLGDEKYQGLSCLFWRAINTEDHQKRNEVIEQIKGVYQKMSGISEEETKPTTAMSKEEAERFYNGVKNVFSPILPELYK